MNKKLVATLALIVAPALGMAQNLVVKVADPSARYSPLTQDPNVQSIFYLTNLTTRNLESRSAIGSPMMNGDDRMNWVGPYGADPKTVLVYGHGAYFANPPAIGDVIQSVTFWMAGGRLKLSWDSIDYQGESYVYFGTNDTVTVQNPRVMAGDSGNLVQWHSLAEPLQFEQGARPFIQGAIWGWNVYRLERVGAPAEFLAHVPNSDTDISYLDEAVDPTSSFIYGIVPVLRSAGAPLGPQGEGIELRRFLADGTSLPLITLQPLVTNRPPLQ